MHTASFLLKVINWSCKFRCVFKEAFKTLIDIVNPVNVEQYTTAKIYLFISTLGANHVMLI